MMMIKDKLLNMGEKYQCQVYYVFNAFLVTLIIAISLWVIIIIMAINKISLSLGLFPIVLSLTFPFIFQKKIRSLFTRIYEIEFNNHQFTITKKKNESAITGKPVTYLWNDLARYKINFTLSGFTVFDFYFQNKKHKKFVFIDKKSEEESIAQRSVFNVFRHYIKAANGTAEKIYNPIELVPGFLATKRGLTTIRVIGILMLITISIHVLKHNNHFFLLLIGILCFIPLFAARTDQQRIYNKIKNLGP
jgi:hypothetical protein